MRWRPSLLAAWALAACSSLSSSSEPNDTNPVDADGRIVALPAN